MSRDTSITFRQAVQDQETDEIPILLLTLDHDTLSTPIRLCNDGVDMVSRGNTYTALPMNIILADDNEERLPTAKITIDNVDREITTSVRTISTPPTVTIELVLASDPDTLEATYPNFTMGVVDYNQLTVAGTLSLEDFTDEPFPGGSMLPSNFRGLF